MMGTEVCSARMLTSAFREESGDEELAVLPRHTKVIVTGNNRTKSVLVGLQGVVKKAVGFGGWHWLVLKNGVEVKLQRNALSVLEPPTGNEEDNEIEFSDSSAGSDIGENHNHHFSSTVKFGRLHNPRVRYARPWVQAAPPKKSVQRSSSREAQFNQHVPQQVRTININRKQKMIMENLGTDSLSRYCQSYKLASINPDSPKEQLVKIVQQHFSSQRVDEGKVVVDFVRAAKKLRAVDAH